MFLTRFEKPSDQSESVREKRAAYGAAYLQRLWETNDRKEGNGLLTNKQLASFCEKVYSEKWCYWYGTYGKKCSQALYNEKRKQYPEQYTASRENGYMTDIRNGKTCADCAGMLKAFFWKGGNTEATPKYASNGFKDRGADSIFKLCKEYGVISTIPDIPGLVVWRSGHIGVYVGNGMTIEMKGFAYDCVRQKVEQGTWTHWGKLPKDVLEYIDGKISTEEPIKEPNLENTKDNYQVVRKVVRITKAVNIRYGNGTEYAIATTVDKGSEFEYVATAVNGWYAIKFGSQIMWVSGNYSEAIDK